MPDWISTAPFPASTRDGEKRVIDYALVDDELALLWMVNMGCIDMHAWASRADRPERPDWVMFDLDPAEGATFENVLEVAGTRPRDARPRRPRVVAEDEWLAWHPRARAHLAAPRLGRGAGVRGDHRRRARPSAPRPRDDRVDEGEAAGRARRREPERSREDDRIGLLGPPALGCPGLDATALGRGALGARPVRVHHGRRARARRRRKATSSRGCSRAGSRSAPRSARFASSRRRATPAVRAPRARRCPV